MGQEYDAVIVGSGPNGLAAAIRLAQSGARVLVLEGRSRAGGGMRTAELTRPGFLHDICSSCHPMGRLSPYLSTLPLEAHGLSWTEPEVSVAHPLDDEPAVLLDPDLSRTAEALGVDAEAYRRLCGPFLDNTPGLLGDLLGPLGLPKHPLLMARFGMRGLLPAETLARLFFRERRAQALLAGCAGHSVLPLDAAATGAMALVFLLTAHATRWPVAEGGSEAIARAMVSLLSTLGGQVQTDHWVKSPRDLPPARVYLFDTSPDQLALTCETLLPSSYLRRLRRFRYGPGVFKVDWALSDPIPWRDPRVLQASTVHVGGTLEEIAASEAAVWRGAHPERPYLILVQASQHDPSRAPPGQHTGYAYCHVPAHSTVDMTPAIEAQIERFAPGFGQTILARHTMNTRQFTLHNPNYVGGAITGGVTDLTQLFTRPVARRDPYSTPHPRIFLCSSATPPGGGVHGMCGYHAAQSALAKIGDIPVAPLR